MSELFFGDGIAHSILLFAFVIAVGLYLGKFRIKGISIGSTWILFAGLLMGHFGFQTHPAVLAFMKDFGLILFVFSIGLQVAPGFFHSFREGGLLMNMLAVLLVLLTVGTVFALHFITGEELDTLTGVMSGAVTNTPGLGAAQQTLSDCLTASGNAAEAVAERTGRLASAYAVAYPMGVVGVILLLILFKAVFRIDLNKEKEELEALSKNADTARRMHCIVRNPAIFGRKVGDVLLEMRDKMVISRIMRDGVITSVGPGTVFQENDKVLIVTSEPNVDAIRIIFGEEAPMHLSDWEEKDECMVSRRLTVTRSNLTGKSLKSLNIRAVYGVTVTRVFRAGVELVAGPSLMLRMGDSILVVGTPGHIRDLAGLVGNRPETLRRPNLFPIFLGIVAGVICGSLPIHIPGIPHAIRLGLAGGPLIVAILLGYFGPKWKITTYTTLSANMMIREIGISFFMAAVGLDAGRDFVASIAGGGYLWILYGALLTLIPISIVFLVARLGFRLNFYRLCGLIAGGTTNPPVLAFAQNAYGTDYTSVNYATVYPLSMFLRVLVAQLLILFSL